MPDARARYELANSNKVTSEAPRDVVANERKGVCIPRLCAVSMTLSTPICSVIQIATVFLDSASAVRSGIMPSYWPS